MSVIFVHKVVIKRRHFLVSALLPFLYILVLGIGLLLVTLVASSFQAIGLEEAELFGWHWSLRGVSGALLYLLLPIHRPALPHLVVLRSDTHASSLVPTGVQLDPTQRQHAASIKRKDACVEQWRDELTSALPFVHGLVLPDHRDSPSQPILPARRRDFDGHIAVDLPRDRLADTPAVVAQEGHAVLHGKSQRFAVRLVIRHASAQTAPMQVRASGEPRRQSTTDDPIHQLGDGWALGRLEVMLRQALSAQPLPVGGAQCGLGVSGVQMGVSH